jgi:hypothetical protein
MSRLADGEGAELGVRICVEGTPSLFCSDRTLRDTRVLVLHPALGLRLAANDSGNA